MSEYNADRPFIGRVNTGNGKGGDDFILVDEYGTEKSAPLHEFARYIADQMGADFADQITYERPQGIEDFLSEDMGLDAFPSVEVHVREVGDTEQSDLERMVRKIINKKG